MAEWSKHCTVSLCAERCLMSGRQVDREEEEIERLIGDTSQEDNDRTAIRQTDKRTAKEGADTQATIR